MQKKIRILHVAQAAGGVDKFIQSLLKYLSKDIFENIIVCSYSFEKQKYDDLVIAFEQVDMCRAINGLYDLKAIYLVRKLIKKYKPDIVYAHSSKAGAIARISNMGLHNICIYNPHGWAFNMNCSKFQKMVYILIEKIAALFCQKIICISQAEKQSALNLRICPEKKLQVIFNGIDIAEYKNYQHVLSKKSLNIPENAFVIGMVGRISCQKAPDNFIKAAKIIKKHIPNAYFIIVGDGELSTFVYDYAKKYKFNDSLLITGWVNNPMNYIKIFDIAMLLSRWEGFGLVLPEYMVAAKPIIASRIDAIPNIINNRINGLLVEVDNINEIYKATMELYQDTKLCKTLVKNGLNDVYKYFDVKRTAKEHTDLFINMISVKR